MIYSREHRYGLTGTILIHTGILLLVLYLRFIAAPPPQGEEGIMVNFGDSETGLGDIEPSPAVPNNEPLPAMSQEKTPSVKTTPVAAKPKAKTSGEEMVTQDAEQTAAIEAARKKKEENRLIQLEVEKERKAEQERLRQEAETRKKQEEENRRIAEINTRTKGAFGNPAGGPGGTGSGNGKSQGVTFPGGNQGVPTGDPNSNTYGPGGGTGTKGSGISYDIAGRTATSMPKPNYPGKEEGTVVVKITVDRNGKVTIAEPGQRGTTTMNPDLYDAAKRAALLARFNVDENAPAFQTGTITYRFIIQSQ
jgi:colicin import membrane protein